MIGGSGLRFVLTGAGATSVHGAVMLLLVRIAGWPYASSHFVAAAVAMLISWLVNTVWSFGQRPNAHNAWRFLTVAVLGAFLSGLVGGIAQQLEMDPFTSLAPVVAIVTPITYLLHRYWTYRGIQVSACM